MTENALAVTGPDWKAMTHEHRGPVLADYIDGFRRHTLVEFWIIGRGLEIHQRGMNQGDWYAYLDSINMRPAMASELRRLARGYPTIEELQRHATKDAAIKALPPATPPAPTVQERTAEIQRSTGPDREQEPAEPGESRTTRENVPVHVPAPEPEPEADPKAVIDAVAAEVELTPAELRDQRLERLAIMTEDIDGDVV